MQQVSWTVTQAEYDATLSAAVWRSWLTLALPMGLATLSSAALAGSAVGWPYFFVLGAAGLACAGAIAFVTWRSTRRMFAACYPVGATLTAQASDDAYVMRTASGAMELPWDRIGRHRLRPRLFLAKDRVSGAWMLIPRPLFPDAWAVRLGA